MAVATGKYIDNGLSGIQEVPVSRVQLALNVDDVDQAVAFYSKLFGTEPAKRRPGYASHGPEAAARTCC